MESTSNLFDRLPEALFRPLGGSQPRYHWALLTHLYQEFFSPDSAPPPGDGWLHRHLSLSVERFLTRWDEGVEVGGKPVDAQERATPLNIRAATVLAYLKDSGWLSEERLGYARYVVMRPTVQSVFELLKVFAEAGPEFIGGRIQVIRNTLRAVVSAPAENASAFHTAAKECTALLRMLNTTRLRVREAMDALRKQENISNFVSSFFDEYIGRLYIADYHEMFSRNHPLHHRWEVVEMADELRMDPVKYEQLAHWYQRNMRARSPAEAAELLDDDFERFSALRRVEELLARLKDAVGRANEQALSYLRYRVRSQGAVDAHVDKAIAAIRLAEKSRAASDPVMLRAGWSSGILFTTHNIRLRDIQKPVRQRTPIVQRVLPPEAQARRLIRQIMRGNRMVSPKHIHEYVSKQLGDALSVLSTQMHIESINDLCVIAALTRLAMMADRSRTGRRRARAEQTVYADVFARIDIELTSDRFENKYLEAPCLRVSRRNSDL
jgi:hypothetical protein